jgi:hypothetical protein
MRWTLKDCVTRNLRGHRIHHPVAMPMVGGGDVPLG